MGEEILKQGMITKRAQQKKSIGPTNYKERVFVLSNSKLQYYEGSMKQRGKLKGSILINEISFVGPIEDGALNRTSAFQVIHNGYHLYCCAKSRSDCEEWIAAIRKACRAMQIELETVYHAKIYSGGKWQCCGTTDKNSQGCKSLQSSDSLKSWQNLSVPCAEEFKRDELPEIPPMPPPRPQTVEIEVVALYDFTPQEPGDMALYQGQFYTIIENSRQHWWKARDQYQQEGYIPANYVTDRLKDNVESKDWYQIHLTRHEAEECLLQDAGEGSFLVRESTQTGVKFTLSVVSKCGVVNGDPKVKHYHLKQNSKGQYYFSEKYPHDSVLDLIYYHKFNAGGLVTRLRHAPERYRTTPPSTNMFNDTQWEIDLSELQIERELGNGQFGVVKLALFRNQQYVAVKMMREGMMEEDSFIEEANVMAQLNHANLVRLYGVVVRQRPICIVTEYMENGCLLDYIRKHFKDLSDQPLVLLGMCRQVCDAMAYLEVHNLIHRDLAARNCLVGRGTIVKVSDFGLTRFVIDDEYTSSFGSKFPIKWAAPEVLNYTKFSSKSDVWAFGILMWEVFSGGMAPYRGMGNIEVVESVVNGHRLDRPVRCPHDVYNVMRLAWDINPENRPAFGSLLHTFYNLEEKLSYNYPHRDY